MARAAALIVLPCVLQDEKASVHDASGMVSLAERSLHDLRLAEAVQRTLAATGYAFLRTVEVLAWDRAVILKGRVASYYMKQVAQAVAFGVKGVQTLRNELEVTRSETGLGQQWKHTDNTIFGERDGATGRRRDSNRGHTPHPRTRARKRKSQRKTRDS